jgi:hypothetical protein
VTVVRVDATRTSVGETWTCTVTASDRGALSPDGTPGVRITDAPTCGDGSVTLSASVVDLVTVWLPTLEMACTPGV